MSPALDKCRFRNEKLPAGRRTIGWKPAAIVHFICVRMDRQIPAILWGDLNLLRPLRMAHIPTVVISDDPNDITFRSRHCWKSKVIANPTADPDGAVSDLIKLGEAFEDKAALFYGDDRMLLLISRNRDELSKYYRFLMPEAELVEDLVDKVRFARLAEDTGLPVPKTVTSHQARTAREAAELIGFPCIIKPNRRSDWFRSKVVLKEGGKPQKAFRADDLDQLARLYDEMREVTPDFVVQEYLPGGDDCIYSFHGYFDQGAEPLGCYIGHKIRTYPRDRGMSTYLELVKEPRLIQLGLEIIKKLGITGPVKIDFKKDAARDRYYLLEINARFNLWNYLGAVCGVNLLAIAYNHLLGRKCPPQSDYRTEVRWLSFGNDLRAFLRDYHNDGDLSIIDLIRSYRGPKVYDVFSWDDPLPFLSNLASYSRALCRHVLRCFFL